MRSAFNIALMLFVAALGSQSVGAANEGSKTSADLAAAFDRMGRENVAALLVLPDDNMTFNSRKRLVALVAERRIPAMFWAREFVEEGGLMSYGENMQASYRHAAVYLDKVLNGTRPADLPIEQPKSFELVINAKTADAMGIAIPPSLRVSAAEVIAK